MNAQTIFDKVYNDYLITEANIVVLEEVAQELKE